MKGEKYVFCSSNVRTQQSFDLLLSYYRVTVPIAPLDWQDVFSGDIAEMRN